LKNPFSTKPPTGTITVATQGFTGSLYYNSDVLDVDIVNDAAALQTLTPNIITGTAERSVTSADSNTEIVCNVTLTNRILTGDYIRIKLPLEQFAQTGSAIQYNVTGAAVTSALTVVSTDSNHVILQYQEFCNTGTLCADGTVMSITIIQGFKNARTVLATTTQFFVYQSYTSDLLYQIDESTSNIIATPAITEAAITSISVSFESSTVTNEGYADILAVLGSTVLAADYIELTFSAEFLLQTSSTVTCGKVVSGVETAVTCTPTMTSGYLSSVIVNGICA
jgi:hypothetical protein